jgi:hypothetical protein
MLISHNNNPARAADSSAAGPATQPSIYLFSYFLDNGEDGLHLAASKDGYHFDTLARGKGLLKPLVGESKLMRDPCLIQGPDGIFRMVWTDSWTGQTIGYSSTKDLIHWSPQKAIPVMKDEPTVLNCWAPVVVYDDAKKDYLIFWASTIPGKFPQTENSGDGKYNHRIYATTTKDFETFTPTKLFFDPGYEVIDAAMLKANNQFYLIYKDETLKPPKKDLHIATSDNIEGPFADGNPAFTPAWREGPTAIKIGDYYMVYYDCYTEHKYGASRSKDLKTWEDVTDKIAFPTGARHGTIMSVSTDIVENLQANAPKD